MEKTARERKGRKSGRESGRAEDAATEQEPRDEPLQDEGSDPIALGEDDLENVTEATDELAEDAEGEEPGLSRDLVAAALIGAAVGAGIGMLASRLFDADDVDDALASARRQMGRGVRGGMSAARRGARAAGSARQYADRAREVFEDALEREVRELRRAARRRRRQLGF